MASIVAWFQAQPAPLQPAYLSAFTSISLFVLGFLTIAGTAWANRRNTLKAARDQQKLEIYKAVLKDIDAASDAQLEASNYVRTTVGMLRIQAEMLKTNPVWPPVRERTAAFEARHYKQLSQLGALHQFVEQWAIVDQRLEVFAKAFGYQRNAVMRAGLELSEVFRSVLPVDVPGQPDKIFAYSPPQQRFIDLAAEMAEKYHYESGLLGAYISDFNVELQPLLLGHLFGRRIVRRDAPDPTQFTIRLDRYRQIVRHFENTDFFKGGKAADLELRKRHGTERRVLWFLRGL